jgi:hypothetical protein
MDPLSHLNANAVLPWATIGVPTAKGHETVIKVGIKSDLYDYHLP